MTSRRRGFNEEAIANLDDSGDSDYDNSRAHGSASKRKRPAARSSASKPRKKAKQRYRDSDIDEDEEDISSAESFLEDVSEVSEPELNMRTGRPVRKSAKGKTFKEDSDEEEEERADYESSEDGNEEIEDDPEDEEQGQMRTQRRTRAPGTTRRTVEASVEPDEPASRIVVLNVTLEPSRFPEFPVTPSRRGRASARPRSASTAGAGARRSSRQARDESEPLFSLTDSGRHAQVARLPSTTPEPQPATHPSRGAKRAPRANPIIEASQEDDDKPEEDDQDAELAPLVTSEMRMIPLADEPAAGEAQGDEQAAQRAVVADSVHGEGAADDDDDADDDEEGPVSKRRRVSSGVAVPVIDEPRRSARSAKPKADESSDFNPEEEEEEEEGDDDNDEPGASRSKRRESRHTDDSSGPRRSTRTRGKASQASHAATSEEDELDLLEMHEEAAELKATSRKRTRRGERILYDAARAPRLRERAAPVDYRVFRPELAPNPDSEEDRPARIDTAPRSKRGGGITRSLFPMSGPFGGMGGPTPVLSTPGAGNQQSFADLDSSDDELGTVRRPSRAVGGTIGLTPASAGPVQPFGFASLGSKEKAMNTTAPELTETVDPLGLDQNVTFDSVGGQDDHINQLKEMVIVPLLYPEVFKKFQVKPPRGVLFHGPPGTGKTHLARALAASLSKHGIDIKFYMRKGSDILSKYVGEGEQRIKALFEEARKSQPSIIFFDEIDALAPVRSSNPQEQHQASIVSTLLAYMDGVDDRGQVIVIGATNRPDSVDPALRRPGRFDREFLFSLPDEAARRSILDIHTRGWNPPLPLAIKEQLARITKGYSGADLSALCTEAAINAIQGTYPQIFGSNEKLLIDPAKIRVLAKDFLLSVRHMIPSSARSNAPVAAPIKTNVEPLLRNTLQRVNALLDTIIPRVHKKTTALEEAMYDDRDSNARLDIALAQQDFDSSRVFRPRLLVFGTQGMGQHYVSSAVLHSLDGYFVQSFDMSILQSDSMRSPEAAVTQLFQEARRNKPSVIYIPNVNLWAEVLGQPIVRLLSTLLRTLQPDEPVLLFGYAELQSGEKGLDPGLIRDLFGYSAKTHFQIGRVEAPQRLEYFSAIIEWIRRTPDEFPNPEVREKRRLEVLPVAPSVKRPETMSREELKAQKKQDRYTLNKLKIAIQPVMDHIKKYRKFRFPVITEDRIAYLFDEQDPQRLGTDLAEDQQDPEQQASRPFELKPDGRGIVGLRGRDGTFFYNLDIVVIEKRLSNGFYKRPRDFLADIRRLAKDAKMANDEERLLRANELVANVEVDMQMITDNNPDLVRQCEDLHKREKAREELARQQSQQREDDANASPSAGRQQATSKTTTTNSSGPIMLGEPMPGRHPLNSAPLLTSSEKAPSSNGYLAEHGDTQMSEAEEEEEDDEERKMPTQPSNADTQGQRSQQSGFIQMATNSQPGDYHNSASTTTSGQKTSDRSGNTQSTNGTRNTGPAFDPLTMEGGSQLPDTQDPNLSSSELNRSSQMGPPQHRHSTSINDILNKASEASRPTPPLILDGALLENLREQLVLRSSGCTVEQLEQVNAAMMDAIKRTRGFWNRNDVMQAVSRAFNEKIEDIETMGKIADSSPPDAAPGARASYAASTRR